MVVVVLVVVVVVVVVVVMVEVDVLGVVVGALVEFDGISGNPSGQNMSATLFI